MSKRFKSSSSGRWMPSAHEDPLIRSLAHPDEARHPSTRSQETTTPPEEDPAPPTAQPPLAMKIPNSMMDFGGGFVLSDEEEDELIRQAENIKDGETASGLKIVSEPLPDISNPYSNCDDCGKRFINSFLMEKFDCKVCDDCRANDEKYDLITKTDAKSLYLLSDGQLDGKGSGLRFIEKRNPHHRNSFARMKLFLLCQVEQRAFERWGGLDQLQAELDRRAAKAQGIKQKRFDNKMREMRQKNRLGKLYTPAERHVHQYGAGREIEGGEGKMRKECSTCGHVVCYEVL
eukprot:Nk52_evm40s153 gene=Nk52_evmTU40s153